MFKKKSKSDKIKIQFNITFISIKELPANFSGKEVWIECKRGKKPANTKSTRHLAVKEKDHPIDDKLSFSVSFVQKDKKFEPKKEIAFSLMENNGKKGEAIAKNKLDLSEYAEPGSVRHHSITLLNKDKKKSGTLALKIEAQPVKIGDKMAVKTTASGSAALDKPTVTLGGENYTLQTSDEITETNASNSDGEEDIDFPDEDKELSKGGTLRIKSPPPVVTSSNDSPAKSSLASTAEKSTANAAMESAALADAKRDNDRLTRKIERLETAAQTSNQTNLQLESDLNTLKDKMKELKKDLQEKNDENSKLEEDLLREKNKSKAAPVSSSISPPSSNEDKEKISELEKKNAKLEKQIRQLKEDLEEVNDQNALKEKKAQKQMEELKKELEKLKQDLEEKMEENSKLEQDLAKEKSKPSTTTSVSASSIPLSSSNEDKEKISELEKKNVKLEKQIRQLKEDLEEVNDQNALKEKKTARQLEESKKGGESLKLEVEEKTTQIQQLKEELLKEKEKARTVPVAVPLPVSSSPSEETKKQIESLKKELKEKAEENDKLKQDLSKEKEKAKSTTVVAPVPVPSSSSSNEDKEKAKELEKKNAKLEKQIQQLKEDLEEVNDQSTHKEKKLQKLLDESEKEVEKLQSELETSKVEKSAGKGNEEGTKGGMDEEEAVKLKLAAKRAERETESLKKKINALQKENREKGLVENGIYAADVEYEEETPVGVNHIVEGMMEWNAFDPFNEELTSSILNAIKKSFARSAYDSETLTYWLSFSIHLFQKIKSQLPSDISIDENAILSSDFIEDLEEFDSVTRFLLELIHVSFDIYSVLLINIFSQLDSVLISSILSVAESKGKKTAPTGDFTGLLNDTMKMLKKHHLSDSLVKSFVQQMFSFIDSQLFNNLIQKPELFTCSAGFQIKMAISQVESNVAKLDKSLTFINKSLNHIKEAVNFLVMDKSIVTDADMVEQIFSHLNVVQLKHMIDRFKPDDLSPDPVPEVAKKAVGDAARKRSDLPLELDAMDIKKINLLAQS